MSSVEGIDWGRMLPKEVIDVFLDEIKDAESYSVTKLENGRRIKARPQDIQELLCPLVDEVKEIRSDVNFDFVHPLGGNEGSLTIEFE